MKKFIFLITIFFSIIFLYSNEEYNIIFDQNFSEYVGAEDILATNYLLEQGFDKFLNIKKGKKIFPIILRAAKLIFLYQPLAGLEVVIQHEVFGHGYRIRDISSHFTKVTGYRFDLPFPYGNGGGATGYDFNENFTSFQEIAISIAGVESNAILANRIKMKWMESNKIDPLKSTLYIQSFQDLTGYIYSMDDSPYFVNEGHDIESYLFWLNTTYYNKYLSKRDLKISALINLLDPFTYFSIFDQFYYVFTGKELDLLMIKIKNLKYLPSFRLGLAPYGIEYFSEHFFSYKNRPIFAYLRYGKFLKSYFGIGIEMPKLLSNKNYDFGFKIDLFNQPKIYYKSSEITFDDVNVFYDEKDLSKKIYGVSASIFYQKKFKQDKAIYLQLGYKTKGFVPAEDLRNSIIARIGITIKTL
ncbi:MAG: hypothetical protein K1060chlam5_00682 [Candidatus Anoxychlamydiales bacterium]|nr:hypothetical protein [Candidatus Anoxychlamydiales bacterium]